MCDGRHLTAGLSINSATSFKTVDVLSESATQITSLKKLKCYQTIITFFDTPLTILSFMWKRATLLEQFNSQNTWCCLGDNDFKNFNFSKSENDLVETSKPTIEALQTLQ